MTNAERTTPAPKCATPDLPDDQSEYEEPEDAAVRAELGLRPIHYVDRTDVSGLHPDQRPCPTWCWVGQDPDSDHEIEQGNPMYAMHSFGARPSIVASQYRGGSFDGGGKRYVTPATIEADMEQRGQGSPRISLYLRHTRQTSKGLDRRFDKVLMLSLTDAEELVTVLQYLVKRAEA